MFGFNHSFKEAGRKGGWTTTEKAYSARLPRTLGTPVHIPTGQSAEGLFWNAGSNCLGKWSLCVCVCVCGECAGGKGAESRRMLVEEEEKGERRSGTGGATEEPGSAQVMLE